MNASYGPLARLFEATAAALAACNRLFLSIGFPTVEGERDFASHPGRAGPPRPYGMIARHQSLIPPRIGESRKFFLWVRDAVRLKSFLLADFFILDRRIVVLLSC